MTPGPLKQTYASLPAVVPGTGARIDELTCIGCLKCVRACPVDAIIGAAGLLHAVVPQWCIGCGLCLPPCPVDCINLIRSDAGPGEEQARERFLARLERGSRPDPNKPPAASCPGLDEKRAYIREAVQRARARRAGSGT